MNQLFQMAAGEFLLLLHDDNLLMPDALSSLIAPLRRNPSVIAAFGKMEKLSIPVELEELRRSQLRELAPVAVNGCLLTSARARALKVLFGKNYPWTRQFIKGSIQFCLAFAPQPVSSLLVQGRWHPKQALS